jgi:molybdate transport system substrate-binding protein
MLARTIPCPRWLFFLVALLCMALPCPAQKKQIHVAAASDLQTVMPQIAKAFEARTHVAAELTFGSSGNLFSQIQNGAPFDVFFSADDEFPARLIQANLAEPRSSLVFAVGSLVLWIPANTECHPQIEKWSCLLKPAVAKIAIANPAHAPYGRAAVSALQSAHIYDQVRAKLVLGENVSQAAQFVQSGNAQAGLLAFSQVHAPAMSDGEQWEIPRDNYPPIQQTVVVLRSAREKSAAYDFLKFVSEGPGHALLDQFGFQPPPPVRSGGSHK